MQPALEFDADALAPRINAAISMPTQTRSRPQPIDLHRCR